MTPRERYLSFMRFETVDRPPFHLPGGPWPTTLRRWHQEGLPPGVSLNEYFGCDAMPVRSVGIETLLWPRFEERLVEETAEYVIKVDSHGVKVRNFHDETSMPEHLEYPITGPESLDWLRERLAWEAPGRIRDGWAAEARRLHDAGTVLFCNGGMYFAFLNEHMGTDRLMYSYFDHPDFIHEVNDLLCTLCEKSIALAAAEVELDYIGYHEDMGYKNGPLISPEMFREFMTPYYRRIRRVCQPHGLDFQIMDSDGDVRQLLPLWLEVGINTIVPCEVAAGMDVVALRAEYGHALRMQGGFDKRILASTPAAIRREVERLRPVMEEGGYLIACDHGVPHDVSFANYCCLVDCLKTICGLT